MSTEIEEVKDSPEQKKEIKIKPSDRFNLREKLLTPSLSEKGSMKTEILKTFEGMFVNILRPYTSMVFHEVLFFDLLSHVKYQLLGPMKATISTALANPQLYTKCECCKLECSDDIAPEMSDINILYKLHLECGRQINLCDWMDSFAALVTPSGLSKKNEVDPEIRARFMRGISELQFLGFIKPTKRKTDHVQRLL